ncbi:hypothetical protein [Massilia timonae]|uniref:hypothetical protein n=1 Tax=Massilia timonae TaxID=47229 RepID=UPI0028D8CA8F|nr:hypothetical protein [Massilia timonae]
MSLNDVTARAEAKRDFTHKEEARIDASTSEGLKLLLALNGGACLAILGFFQALMSKEKVPLLAAFAAPGVVAMCFFAVSLVFAAAIPIIRTLHLRSNLHNAMTKNLMGDTFWTPVAFSFWWIALACLAAGLGCTGYGLFAAASQSASLLNPL